MAQNFDFLYCKIWKSVDPLKNLPQELHKDLKVVFYMTEALMGDYNFIRKEVQRFKGISAEMDMLFHFFEVLLPISAYNYSLNVREKCDAEESV